MSEQDKRDAIEGKDVEGQSEEQAVEITRRKMLKKFGTAALAVTPAVISTTAMHGLPTVGTRI
ncbi:MAG: hypothetical protein HQL50_06690 [Magnetococcales bacterium]|nr:hypothetical protein [Magnetococcales bacterium]